MCGEEGKGGGAGGAVQAVRDPSRGWHQRLVNENLGDYAVFICLVKWAAWAVWGLCGGWDGGGGGAEGGCWR